MIFSPGRSGWIPVVTFAPAMAVAAGQPAAPVAGQASAGLLQVLLGLAVVLALIAGCAWLIRRFSPGALASQGGLRVVGGVFVGPKERVVLVEFRDNWLLLGVTAGQVNLLHASTRPEDGASDPVAGFKSPAFSAWLQQTLRNGRSSDSLPDR